MPYCSASALRGAPLSARYAMSSFRALRRSARGMSDLRFMYAGASGCISFATALRTNSARDMPSVFACVAIVFHVSSPNCNQNLIACVVAASMPSLWELSSRSATSVGKFKVRVYMVSVVIVSPWVG